MSKDYIGYDKLVDRSLRAVVRDALRKVSEQGLVGNHHLYLSFRTDYPGVTVPEFLRERYPEELTIVLQHQFWGLEVGEDGFSVMLSFHKAQENIEVPFAALTRFADPSVKFGLQFEPAQEQASATTGKITRPEPVDSAQDAPVLSEVTSEPEAEGEDEDEAEGETKVITLDSFRKK